MSEERVLDFWFDFSSPYSYIANTWVDALARRHGRRVRRHAILLGVTFAAAELKSPVSYPLKREYTLRDFARSARYHGLDYQFPEVFPQMTQHAARVFWFLHGTDGPARADDWARRAFGAVFQKGYNLGDLATVEALAVEAGLAAGQATAISADAHWKNRLREACDAAIAVGVFGAPYFVVDGEPFWGNDRQPQLARWLTEGPY